MTDLRTYLNGLTDEQFRDAKREVSLQEEKRVPKKSPSEMTDREVQAWTEQMIREGERKKAQAAQGAANE